MTNRVPPMVSAVRIYLGRDPEPGGYIAAQIGGREDEVYEALVWMEAREEAALRPIGGDSSLRSRVYGWVQGRLYQEAA